MSERSVGVVGLGLFGRTVARTLAELGVDVVAVDRAQEPVDLVREAVTHAVQVDVTDPEALKASGLLACDLVVVAIGEDMGSSILVTALLKQHGVRSLIARSHSDLHAQVLHTLGAQRTLDPEEEMGLRLAREIVAPDVHARMRLSTGQEVVEVRAHHSLLRRSVQDLAFRQKYRLNIIAIKRRKADAKAGDEGPGAYEVNKLPQPSDLIVEGDVLVLIGDAAQVQEFLDL